MRQRISAYIWDYDAASDTAERSIWHHFLQIMAMIYSDLMGGMLTLRAMGLVYTTLLSIVPLLAVSLSVLKGFGVHDRLEPVLIQVLAPLGSQSVEIAARIIEFVENMKVGLLSALGLGLLIFAAISLIHKIESAINHTWRLQPSRNMVKRFSDYLSVILVGPILVITAFGITASLASNEMIATINSLSYLSELIRVVGKLLPFLLVIVAFTIIYLLVPNTRVHPRSAFYGALVAGILWQSIGILFTSFVGGSGQYTAIYSGLAVLLVFMIWLYLSWLILLIGASISYYHQNPERIKWGTQSTQLSARMREQIALQAMVNIAQAHDQQSEMQTSIESLASYQRVPVDMLQPMLDALEWDELLTQSADDPPEYLPARSIQLIKLVEILRSARDAEDSQMTQGFRSDEPVSKLLDRLDQEFEASLSSENLAEFINRFASKNSDEDSLVQRQ